MYIVTRSTFLVIDFISSCGFSSLAGLLVELTVVEEGVRNEDLRSGSLNEVVQARGQNTSKHGTDPVDYNESALTVVILCVIDIEFIVDVVVCNSKRSCNGWIHTSSRDSRGADNGGEKSNSDDDSISLHWWLVVVAADAKNGEGEEEESEHLREHCDERVFVFSNVRVDPIGVELFVFVGFDPKEDREASAAGSAQNLSDGV